ncbi:MAG: LCP family protein [Lactobacillaceae bacterium]|jgi:LCP family protein required for cell wall assembly|nr:LCP family protein [Lactobacillaceae bacterium]
MALFNKKKTKIKSLNKKRNPHLVRNIVLVTFGSLLSIALVFLAVAYANTANALQGSHTNYNAKKARDVNSVLNDGRPISILLLGTDTGEIGRDYTGRTDTIILMTMNPKKKTTTMVSFPRDAIVSIPGNKDIFPQKINAAYEYSLDGGFDNNGSPETTIKLIQDWLNVPIDYYALVNMNALVTLINQIGGVSVVSPLTFDFDPDDEGSTAGQKIYHFTEGSSKFSITTPEGTTEYDKMNGDDALAFARMRKTDPLGDYGRQIRQRLILTAIAKHPTELISQALNEKFLKSMAKNLKTDLTFDDMTAIASKYLNAVKHIKSTGGETYNTVEYAGLSWQLVGKTQKQEITDMVRKNLGLKKAKTGTDFGGELPDGLNLVLGDNSIDGSETTATVVDSSTSSETTTYGPTTSYSGYYGTSNGYGQTQTSTTDTTTTQDTSTDTGTITDTTNTQTDTTTTENGTSN